MKTLKSWTMALLSFGSVVLAQPTQAREWSPKTVIDGVYAGIQQIHGYANTPNLIWNVAPNSRGGCGLIQSSQYCKLNHTVYITQADTKLAYQHGDAALAYIVGHEYAHAMQTVYGFQPRTTPISELQADCLAGVYMGLIPNIVFDNRDLQEISTFAYRIGDYAWGTQHHHGTPQQRLEAVTLGMQAVMNGQGVEACLI